MSNTKLKGTQHDYRYIKPYTAYLEYLPILVLCLSTFLLVL